MSRSGYTDDCDDTWAMIRWQGARKKAINGKRGQQFFKDLLAALDAMPVKRLVADVFEENGEVCTIAALGKARGIDMSRWDPEDEWEGADQVAKAFNIAPIIVREVEFENDEDFCFSTETPEQRWVRMREWVASQIKSEAPR